MLTLPLHASLYLYHGLTLLYMPACTCIMEVTSCESWCEYWGGSGLNRPPEIFWKSMKRLSPSLLKGERSEASCSRVRVSP